MGDPGVPGNNDIAFLTAEYFFLVPVSYRAAVDPELNSLFIDANNMLNQLDRADFNALSSDLEVVGWNGEGESFPGETTPIGIHNQRGGTNTVNDRLILGFEAGSKGIYDLSGTARLSVGGDASDGSDAVIVGRAGVGEFRQLGGSHEIWQDLTLGRDADSSGRYDLFVGELLVRGTETIGEGGVGEVSQSGGTHTVQRDLVLAAEPGSEGSSYELSVGTLTVWGASPDTGGLIVGKSDSASFLQRGASTVVDVVPALILGQDADGEGLYELRDGTLRVDEDSSPIPFRPRESLLVGALGHGRFVQSGGSVTVGNEDAEGSHLLVLGAEAGGHGEYELSDGDLTVFGRFYIGRLGEGEMVQSGGTVDIHRDSLLVGIGAGGGRYELRDGEVTVLRRESSDMGLLQVGGSASATFDQSGGEVTLSRAIVASGGEYLLSDGTFEIQPSLEPGVGELLVSNGTFSQTGGSATAAYLTVGGRYELHDGELGVRAFSGPGGSILGGHTEVIHRGDFVQSGGTHTVEQDLTVRNTATYDMLGGALDVGGDVHLFGVFNHYVGADVAWGGDFVVERRGDFEIGQYNLIGLGASPPLARASATDGHIIVGDVINHGTVRAIDTTADFRGTFTNNGAYISDPSDNRFVDLVVGPDGYVVGGAGDRFFIGGDFRNSSKRSALWDTRDAALFFDGAPAGRDVHEFLLAGADRGALLDALIDNFAWGALSLALGETLTLLDGNDIAGAALYVGLVDLVGGLGQLGDIVSDYNIYYDATLSGNAWLDGGSHALGGTGWLIPLALVEPPPSVPAPATLGLLALGLPLLVRRSRRQA